MTHKEEDSETEEEGDTRRQECLLNNQTWYILSSCLVSFFAPGIIMILVYCKIYRVAKQRASTVFVAKNVVERQPSQSETCFVGTARKGGGCGGKSQYELDSPRPVNRHSSSNMDSNSSGHRREDLDDIDLEERSCKADAKTSSSFSSALRFPRRAAGSVKTEEGKDSDGSTNRLKPPPLPPPSCASISWASSDQCSHHFLLPSPVPLRSRQMSLSKNKVAQMREKRFTFVLAVVMGVFVLCWFPFFFTYSLHAVCRENCTIPDTLFNLFFWIGYCNSCLNPIIYTIFNRDFRRAFKKILFETHKRT
ncbi:Alpha-2Db adrenergic receptor [Nibea albiflora]|uniref:Alpha-2Db adrenergic receptor n=1 Tax=Nibea albiflora TaxID=240163 RepID=A0ACB7EJX0_NIBAL|nr:Alpha-2Db adrenergic receptor [Nibea albiflora]